MKDLFKNQHDVKIKDVKVGSWIEVQLAKPVMMNGMGFTFSGDQVDGFMVKPKGLKVFVKEFGKDAPVEESKADEEAKVEETKAEEPKVDEAKNEEIKVEVPKADEPKVEEAQVDEEAKVEENKVEEEPKADETKIEDGE